MSELQLLYFISSALVLLVIVIRSEAIDAKTMFGLGTIIYGLPLFLGYTRLKLFYIEGTGTATFLEINRLDWRVYAIYFMCQGVFFIACLFKTRPLVDTKRPESLFFYAIILNILLFWPIFVITMGGIDRLFLPKYIRGANIFYFFCSIAAASACIFYALYGQKKHLPWLIVPGLVFASDLVIMQMRETVFLTLLSVVVAYFTSRNIRITIGTKLILGSLGTLALAAALMYDRVYYGIVYGTFSWSLIPAYLQLGASMSEPFTIMTSFNMSVLRGIHLPDGYLAATLLQYVPLYQTVGGGQRDSFNDFFQQQLFPDIEWGIGSTCWGELYNIGGFVAITLFLGVIFLYLILNPPQNPYLRILYYYILPYMVVYVHRTDWHYFIRQGRMYFIVSVSVFLIYGSLQFARTLLQRLSTYQSAYEEDRSHHQLSQS